MITMALVGRSGSTGSAATLWSATIRSVGTTEAMTRTSTPMRLCSSSYPGPLPVASGRGRTARILVPPARSAASAAVVASQDQSAGPE
ncbi:hypothetical protein ABZ901_15905 [Actinacidiphila alni]|uniref:hypothetical protein n=1 Tax=Actinacidiphila alni TaxID=380248 RepID=UPI0033CD6827